MTKVILAQLKKFLASAGWLVVLAACSGAFLYLFEADYRSEDPIWTNSLTFGLMIAAALSGLVAALLGAIGWGGPIPAPVAGGYAWRRSIRSRLSAILNLFGFWLAPSIYYAGQESWAHGDLLRAGLAGLLLTGCAVMVWQTLTTVFGLKPVIQIDSEGLRAAGLRGVLSWDRIDSITVDGDLDAREVTLRTLTGSGAPGREDMLSLNAAGLPVRTFLHLVEEVAPQVTVRWPVSRIAAFSEA